MGLATPTTPALASGASVDRASWRPLRRLAFVCLTAYAAAACGSVIVVTPGASGDVLPVEAGRIVDAATATAAGIATQNAQATATDQAARATSTAASLGTHDALAVEQTHAALQLTQAAGAAGATDAAAVRTQTAQDVRDARQAAQDATSHALTPTAAAMATQNALGATQAAQGQARAESAGEFWAWLRWATIGALIGLAMVFCVVVVVRAVALVRVEVLREQAAIAREAFRLLPPGHWAEWEAGSGYQVYPLPGLLDAPATVVENTPTAPDQAHAWRQAVRLFAWWGDRYGFGLRELGPSGAGVVSDPDWRRIVKMLKAAGVLADATLPGRKGRATAWAVGWDYRRLHDELGSGRLALPFPAEDEAPKVAYTVPNTTPQLSQHNTTTQKGAPHP